MSKVQIEKDLKELYGEGNLNLQVKTYYRKKRKEMILLIISVVCIVIASVILEVQQTKIENNALVRNPKGEGKKEYELEIKLGEEKWQPFHVILEEKEYTTDELDILVQSAMEELTHEIVNENSDLNTVETDLNLITQMNEYPFTIRWISQKPEKIEEDGTLNFENIKEKETVELMIEFQYGLWKKIETIQVTLIPKNEEDALYYLGKKILKEQANERENADYYLPKLFRNQELKWRYPRSNATKVILIIFLLLIPFISYQKDMEVHRMVKIRREELLSSFPEFISRLILYIEAGMSVQGAFLRMEQEQKKKKKKNYFIEELSYVCRQMKNGLPQKEGYELLAKRCNLSCYRKLTGLIIQHMEKGSMAILESLRMEAKKAQEEQKARIQKKGEEIGTKLLFPMIIMLGIVMVFIMVPALFSFQI